METLLVLESSIKKTFFCVFFLIEFKGYWKPGRYQELQWLPKKVVKSHSWKPTINFELFFQTFLQGGALQLARQSKSKAICENSLQVETISSVACDCTSSTNR